MGIGVTCLSGDVQKPRQSALCVNWYEFIRYLVVPKEYGGSGFQNDPPIFGGFRNLAVDQSGETA
jgi:hypothetical protein